MKTKSTSYQRIGRISRGFGIFDRKGRELGANMTLAMETFEEIPEESTSWSTIAPGTYFVAVPHATRGREPYGRLQEARHFATVEERDSYVDRYFREAEKRAWKKVGR